MFLTQEEKDAAEYTTMTLHSPSVGQDTIFTYKRDPTLPSGWRLFSTIKIKTGDPIPLPADFDVQGVYIGKHPIIMQTIVPVTDNMPSISSQVGLDSPGGFH